MHVEETAVQEVVKFIAAGTLTMLGALFVKTWRSMSATRKTLADMQSLMPDLKRVTQELTPNGGGSLRDKVDRIERLVSIAEGARRLLMDVVTGAAIYEANGEGSCTYVNRGWSTLTGLTLDEARGSGWVAGVAEHDRKRVLEAWMLAVVNRHEFSLDYDMVDREGRVTPVHGVARMLRDSRGDVVGVIGTVQPKEV